MKRACLQAITKVNESLTCEFHVTFKKTIICT